MFGFPLLLIPLAICNIIVFLMPGVSFGTSLFTVPLVSGASWTVSLSDAMVTFGLFLLLLEVQKSARTGGKFLTDHLLSFLIFVGAAAEFLMLPQFANATFFLLTVVALVDFLSGIGLRSRRHRRVREDVAEPVREPMREPVAEREFPAIVETARPVNLDVEPLPPRVDDHAPTVVVAPRVEPIVEAKPIESGETVVRSPANP